MDGGALVDTHEYLVQKVLKVIAKNAVHHKPLEGRDCPRLVSTQNVSRIMYCTDGEECQQYYYMRGRIMSSETTQRTDDLIVVINRNAQIHQAALVQRVQCAAPEVTGGERAMLDELVND